MLELLREASCTGKPEHGSGGEGGHGGEDDAFGGEVGHAGKPADGPGELAIPGTPSASSGGASRDGSACKPADGLGKLADGLPGSLAAFRAATLARSSLRFSALRTALGGAAAR